MKKFFQWIRDLLSDSNTVNEHTVLGFIFAISAIVGGFTKVDIQVFYAFMVASLACFGLKFIKY